MHRLSTQTIDRLSAYLPRADLEAMRPVRVAPFRWLPSLLGMGAVTFWHYVCFRRGAFDELSARGLALIAHETVHIGQVRELGLPRFLLRYIAGQFRCRFRHDRHQMEIPAIELQRRVRSELEDQPRRSRRMPPSRNLPVTFA